MEDVPPEGGWKDLDAVVEIPRVAFSARPHAEAEAIRQGEPTIFGDLLEARIARGDIRVLHGEPGQVSAFFGHFQPRPTKIVPVVIHPRIPTAFANPGDGR